ncbi:sugar ABC transporter permease [Demequina sp. SYSU T00192]|uniref:Sugar ABC transporter permease n=1 Tax=Demequina litoralis TaxID=3051660 RepID=A0ABT8G6K2_9MICO|nr:sugar ABC transporter permease [Demequina sp. SYSU T00192]MDN4474778.1 sugar ABC transporter permease [Demequina sp. SYSU T00192]
MAVSALSVPRPVAAPALPLLERRRRLAGAAFLAPAALYMIVFFGYPMVHNLVMGSQDYSVSSFYTGDAPFVGFDNYAAIFSDPAFWPTLGRTAMFTVASIVFQFVIGLALAVFFVRRFPLSGVIRALLLLPWLLPLVVSASVWRWIFDQDNGILNIALRGAGVIDEPIGWLNTVAWSLVSVIITNIWIGIPFNLVLLHGGLQAIPGSLYEAAALDGAGPWRQFTHISWPLLKPVTQVTLVLGLVYTLKVFDVIAVMTGGGPASSSQTLTVWSYQLSFNEFLFGQGAAVGNLLIVIALIAGLAYVRSAQQSLRSAS